MGHDHHVVGFDQARLSVFCQAPASIDNRYDGPLLADTPQYFFVTDFVTPSYVKKSFSKATSHSSPAFARPLSLRSIIRLHSEKYPR